MYQWPKRRWLDESVIQTVNQVLHHYKDKEEDLPSQGLFEQKYCQAFSNYQGSGYTLALNSGTNSVYVALNAIGLLENEQVICSPVTDFGTVSSLIMMGSKLLIPDSTKDSFNTSLDGINKVFNKSVKGIVLTHSAGEPVSDIEEIQKFCEDKKIWLIEDCSQAHGATVNNQKVGTFGHLAILSTMHSKGHASGGNGGLLYTRCEELFNRARSFSDRGKRFELTDFDSKNPEHILSPSLNFSSDEISCAIGEINLSRLDQVIEKRLSFLKNLSQKLKEKSLPFEVSMNLTGSSPYFCPIKILSTSSNSQAMKEKIVQSGFPCNPHYSFLVKEWSWAKPHLVQSPRSNNVTQFRDNSFNLLFNENFGTNELNKLTSILEQIGRGLD